MMDIDWTIPTRTLQTSLKSFFFCLKGDTQWQQGATMVALYLVQTCHNMQKASICSCFLTNF